LLGCRPRTSVKLTKATIMIAKSEL
jgi:hypothetical protein